MISKQIMLIHALTLLISLTARGQWSAENIPVKYNLNSIELLSENTGWIVGDEGTILYKIEDKWIQYPKITDEDLYSVCFVRSDEGWIVGSKGIILRYDGVKWGIFPSPTTQKLLTVSFRDASHGLAAGTNGTLLVYENGAWHKISNSIRGNIYSVNDTKAGAFLAGGLECRSVPVMILSSLTGRKPVGSFSPGFVEIKSIMTPENVKTWAVGSRGAIFHYDGFEWNRTDIGENIPTLNSVFFKDDNHGLAVGYAGVMLTHSPEGWVKETSPTNVRLNDAAIFGNMYYAVGNDGTVIRQLYDNRSNRTDPDPDRKIYVETYPNPAEGKVNIIIPESYDMKSATVIVTNLYGQAVYVKNHGLLTGGQILDINTSDLSDGIYFVRIVSSGVSTTGKFIVKQ
jgi:photosystem II stability/assembly factor-like uncharacterized protein